MNNNPANQDHVRPIPPQTNPDQLAKDLSILCGKARESGASDAVVISAGDVIFRPEIREKVSRQDAFPSIHWPLDYPKDNIEEAIRAYRKGILFCVAAGENLPDYGGGPIDNPLHRNRYLLVYEIASILESASFYMGHHLAMGFAVGNCRSVFCPDEKRCVPMLKGKPCIHPNIGRPSMEAAGMDALCMAENAGWITDESRFLPVGLVMVD
ncbi:MAG: hypothetical protein C4522_13305 [Desulfobacteraceae bacterium]|nr:MAG: hypothetical protein C4522_13305 [Desulfobacteraceae bacterium]